VYDIPPGPSPSPLPDVWLGSSPDEVTLTRCTQDEHMQAPADLVAAAQPPVAMGLPVVGSEAVATAYPPAVGVGMPAIGSAAPFPNASASLMTPPVDVAAGMDALQRNHEFPPGLLRSMKASTETFPLRIWIVDNSGSMNSSGGSRIVKAGDKIAKVNATRWQELGDSVGMAAEISVRLGVRTDFNLLNGTPKGQFFTCGHDDGRTSVTPGVPCDLDGMRAVMAESPRGGTPLTEAIERIITSVAPGADKLRANGQQVAVVIATDGLPNNPSTFLRKLQELQQLPVWLIVRLCTDQDNVVEYWTELDKQLEAPLEVLDDLVGEAKEIAAVSPWLTYGPPLHHAREFGCKNKLFDLLDETRLLPSQAKELAELILGCKPLPEPEVDAATFLKQLKLEQERLPSVFHPLKGARQPWFDLKAFGRAVGGKGQGGGCVVC